MTPDEPGRAGGVQQRIEDAIKAFPFWNYRMDDVDPNDEYAEWVADLAEAIRQALSEPSS